MNRYKIVFILLILLICLCACSAKKQTADTQSATDEITLSSEETATTSAIPSEAQGDVAKSKADGVVEYPAEWKTDDSKLASNTDAENKPYSTPATTGNSPNGGSSSVSGTTPDAEAYVPSTTASQWYDDSTWGELG